MNGWSKEVNGISPLVAFGSLVEMTAPSMVSFVPE